MSSPAHINLIGEEVSDEVSKETNEPKALRISKKQVAQKAAKARRGAVVVGGGH